MDLNQAEDSLPASSFAPLNVERLLLRAIYSSQAVKERGSDIKHPVHQLVNGNAGLTWQCLRHVMGRDETNSGNLDPNRGCFLVAGN
jgi:hypothetical protein